MGHRQAPGLGVGIVVSRSIQSDLEELNDLCELKFFIFRRTNNVQQPLRVGHLLDDDRVWLAERANSHCASVDLHLVKYTAERHRSAGAVAVELESVEVEVDQVELRLEIVSKADYLGSALPLPVVDDFLVLVDLKPAGGELIVEIVVESRCKQKFQFAVQKALFTRVERDSEMRRTTVTFCIFDATGHFLCHVGLKSQKET